MFAAFLERRARDTAACCSSAAAAPTCCRRAGASTPLASDRFQVPEYESARNAYPARASRQKEFDYSVYAFGPPAAPAGAGELDVGINDDLNVIRFHAKELTEGRTFRWSQRQSFVIVNRIGAGDRTLALWMNDGGRPAAAPPADVTVLHRGSRARHGARRRRVQGIRRPDSRRRRGRGGGDRRAGPHHAEDARRGIPRILLGTTDDRDLGVMVDRVAIR